MSILNTDWMFKDRRLQRIRNKVIISDHYNRNAGIKSPLFAPLLSITTLDSLHPSCRNEENWPKPAGSNQDPGFDRRQIDESHKRSIPKPPWSAVTGKASEQASMENSGKGNITYNILLSNGH